jgi:hypothetical protein
MNELAAAFYGNLAHLTVLTAKRHGKTAAMEELVREALERGEHVHRASADDGVRCLGGGPRCRVPRQDLNTLLTTGGLHEGNPETAVDELLAAAKEEGDHL